MSIDLVSLTMKYLSPEIVGKIANALGLERAITQKALGAIVPGIVGSIAASAGSPQGLDRLVDAVDSLDTDSLKQMGGMIGGTSQGALIDEGSQLLSAVVGNATTGEMTDAVMRYAGIDKAASKGLVGLAAPAVLGALADLKRSTGLDADGMAGILAGQKENIARALPSDFPRDKSGGWLSSVVPADVTGKAADIASDVAGRVSSRTLTGAATTVATGVAAATKMATDAAASANPDVAGRAVEVARSAAGQVTDAVRGLTPDVAPRTVEAARETAGRVEIGRVETGRQGTAAKASPQVTTRPVDVERSVAARASEVTRPMATTPDASRQATPRVAEAAKPTAPYAPGRTAEANRPASARIPEATRSVGTSARVGVDEVSMRAHTARWMWILPLLAALGGIWWLNDSRQKIAIAEKMQIEAAAKARVAAEVAAAKVRMDAEAAAAKSRADAETAAKVRAEAEAAANKARAEAEAAAAKARADMDARQKAEMDVAAAKARADMDARQKAEMDVAAAKARADMDARQKAEAEAAAAKARADAEARQKTEMDVAAAKTRADMDARQKAEADAIAAKGRADAEARQKAEAEAFAEKARADAEARQKADMEVAAARARADAAARQKAEAESANARRVAEIKACQDNVSAAAGSGQIRFETASATLSNTSFPTLDRLAMAIKACPFARVRVEGHTDTDGAIDRNQRLSDNRAKSVADYLTRAGVEPTRLMPVGLGQTKPIVANDSEQNKARNRRIDFIVEPN